MEKDTAKEIKGQKDEMAKGNGKPAERPRFMFNIADGGFTGEPSIYCRWFLISRLFSLLVLIPLPIDFC